MEATTMQNCGYCQGGELLAKFGIKICDLEVSQLILFKEQSHPGKVYLSDAENEEMIEKIKAHL